MSSVLVVGEHNGQVLNGSTSKAVACALQIGAQSIDVVLCGAEGASLDAICAAVNYEGVRRVLKLARPENRDALAAVLAPQLAKVAEPYSHVLVPATTFGKDLMPRMSALLGVQAITDVMQVVDKSTFVRPTYAGNALNTIKVPEGMKMVGSVRTASYKAVAEGASAPVEAISTDAEIPTHTRFVELRQAKSDRPDLQSASKVVSGGRGVGSSENFAIIFALGDKMGAGVGASRAAVDAGFVPNEMQVGQTGKIIAPALYVAVGISGAIQHLAGIKDAGVIVAINKDADAPIFEVADLGLVGDLFELVPALTKALP